MLIQGLYTLPTLFAKEQARSCESPLDFHTRKDDANRSPLRSLRVATWQSTALRSSWITASVPHSLHLLKDKRKKHPQAKLVGVFFI